MISYREKELMMVQKMLKDRSDYMLEQAISGLKGNMEVTLTDQEEYAVESYDDLVELAHQKGYDTYIRVEDILSKEELEKIDKHKEEIEQKFREKTKLDKVDVAFLFSGVLFQVVRQCLITLKVEENQEKANQAEAQYKKKYEQKNEIDPNTWAKRYYAPEDQIKYTKTVPYDIVQNTKFFSNGKETNLGLSGSNHRAKSLGHDPYMGLIVGTSNILTNTATFYGKNHMIKSYHVSYKDRIHYTHAYIYQNANTAKVLKKSLERLQENPEIVWAALKKEIAHIKSDETSVAGIPIPFLMHIMNHEKVTELSKGIFDYTNFKKVGSQAIFAELINGIIGFLYRIYVLWDEMKTVDDWRGKIDLFLNGELGDYDEVKRRKIILYSNLIASSLNVAICVGGGIAAQTLAPESRAGKKLLSHTDVGGYFVTMCHLFKDGRYILKVKNDFILACAQEDFEKEVEKIGNIDMNRFAFD